MVIWRYLLEVAPEAFICKPVVFKTCGPGNATPFLAVKK